MHNNIRKIVISVLAIILVLLMVVPLVMEIFVLTGGAANTVSSLNERLSKLDKEKAEIQSELNKVRSKKKSATEEKEAIDKKISVTSREIATIDELISQLNADNAKYTKELEEVEKQETETYNLFKQRIRAMEEHGTVSYLTVILSADSFSNLLSRAEIIGNVMQYDRNIINDLKEQQAEISKKRETIAQNKKEQEAARGKLAARKNDLSAQESEAEAILKNLTSEEQAYVKAFNEAEAAQNAAKAEIKKILAAQQASSTKSGKYVGGDFLWPVPSKYTITSYYGYRKDPITRKQSKHTGIDIAAGSGTPIVAANAGTVIVSGWSSKGYGNYIVIDHGGGKSTLYAHQSRLAVKKGAYVKKGQTIGYVGSTGWSTGPHLHFEILINGDDVNPMNYFKKG